MTIEGRLDQVLAHGAPAQATRARQLLEQLAADPEDSGAITEAGELYDAYLHDPYLTKNEGD